MLNLRCDDPTTIMGKGQNLKDLLINENRTEYKAVLLEKIREAQVANPTVEHAELMKAGALYILNNAVNSIDEVLEQLARAGIAIDVILDIAKSNISEELHTSVSILRSAIFTFLESIPIKPTGKEEDPK